MPETISVVIPCRTSDQPRETLESLFGQTYKHLEIIVVIDVDDRGQSWARNRGIEMARRRLILFSDYDCRWEPYAVERLVEGLHRAKFDRDIRDEYRVGYAYGGYHQVQHGIVALTFGLRPWDWQSLVRGNYISTMSLVDADLLAQNACLNFDERLRRLEDWDLWLRCGQKGISGVGVGKILFTTDVKPGVSYGGMSHEEAERQVRKYRGL